MHRVNKLMRWGLLTVASLAVFGQSVQAESASACSKPVYLTFDTGHMGVATLIADVLNKHQVQVTFFAANEATQAGDGSLGQHWAAWWKARAVEGHEFASHTMDHVYWRGDLPEQAMGFRVRPSAGPHKGQDLVMQGQQYCQQIDAAAHRLEELTGRAVLPLFRAPGGKTSPALLRTAQACGYAHVAWSDAGFLGDELPSERYSNAMLLQQSLRKIQPGDILVAHLGIWSRRDAWAPAVLEPLIVGLKKRGLCFATLRTHPAFRNHIAQAKRPPGLAKLPAPTGTQ